MTANVIDVAREAKVAPSTVSNVLNNTKFVSEEIRKRVLDACEKLNYTPNLIASSMKTKKTKLIGLFLASSAEGFADIYYKFIEGVVITAAKNDYNVIIYYDLENRTQLHKLLSSGSGPIDGAIMLTPSKNDFRMSELACGKIEYVLVGKPFDENMQSIPYVDVRNDKITYDVVKKMLDKGKRKVLFLNSEDHLSITNDRLKGYQEALKEMSVNFDEKLVLNVKSSEKKAFEICERCFSEGVEFDAVITESDFSAKGIYDSLLKHSIKIGEGIPVMALGGSTYSDKLDPPLSSVVVDYLEIGRKAMNILVNKLKNYDIEYANFIDAEMIYTKSV